jgi:quercetin dioxygenase-like cupin family protein
VHAATEDKGGNGFRAAAAIAPVEAAIARPVLTANQVAVLAARLQLRRRVRRHRPRPAVHPQALTRRDNRRSPMSSPATVLPPYIRQAAEHQRLAYTGGHELAVILDAAVTGGQLAVIEVPARCGDASPVHVHSRDDEAFLLLDGAMTVWVGEQRQQLQPGGIAFLPRQLPHAVRYDMASRALVLSTPAGFQEGVFRAAGWDLTRPRPKGWQPAPEALRAAAEQHGITLTGPPHGLDD